MTEPIPRLLVAAPLPPGLYRQGTRLQSKGRWYDANGVRWFKGAMQPIGGWAPKVDSSLAAVTVSGVPRGMHAWRGNDAVPWLAIGTNTKLYCFSAGVKTDITPSGFTTGPADGSLPSSAGQYGAGVYGAGPYGVGAQASDIVEPGVWTFDNFGDYLVGVMTTDGKLQVWDRNPSNLAAPSAGAPTNNAAVVVTPESFLVALGANANVRRVQWCSQGQYDNGASTYWTPSGSNTAGSLDLKTTGRIRCGARGVGETLIWTDVDLHALTYIGGALIYGVRQRGDRCGVISPNAASPVINGIAYWMGPEGFYSYNGYVTPLDCPVRDDVFSNLSFLHKAKTVCLPRTQFGEVTWHYTSAGASENDRYVTYNYLENHWTWGALNRTAGVDRGEWAYPMAADSSGNLYEHELGNARSGMTPFAESGPFAVNDGDRVVTVTQMLPDEKTLGDLQLTLFSSIYPTDTETSSGAISSTQPTDLLVSGRFFRLRLDEVRAVAWRFGAPLLRIAIGGRR